MGSIIKQHNDRLLNPVSNDVEPCNCQDKANCRLPDACRTRSTVYTATVEAEGDEYVYHGTAEGEVKKRIGKHKTSFRHRRYENDTALSQFIWKLKDRGSEYASGGQ